ncbi:hypothetical protein Tco_0480824 [Tanacetum coccineum]
MEFMNKGWEQTGKKEDSKALVTIDGEGGNDCTNHSKKTKNHALMACNSSDSTKESSPYVAEILKKFDFANVKTASTPIETQKPLVKDEEASDVDVHLYRSMIGSLMYLTASRPDIMFAVCACSRFQVTPKSSHLSAVKRIFRYLKGKPKLGLWYPRVSSFDLESYSDSDYAGANLDRKSTTGGCQFLGRRLISWQCKKQTIVATSTTEAEYVAAASCCGQVLWIQNQMLDYGFNFMNTKIYIDNESTICIVKNPVYHSKTKHIAIRHHFIRDAYEKKLIQVLKIHTDDNVADLLTKAFDVSSVKITLSTTMAVLDSCPKHNMVAYLEKSEGNAEFHEIIDFLTRSSIHHALTVSPVVSTTFVEQFWTSAKSKIINNVRHITAKVAGKSVSISEASIRSDLLFDDADGIDSLPNQAIFDAIQLMGYEGDLTVLTFNKALFSPQWRFLFHTMNHCISSKSTSWDQIPTNIATAVICLTSNQKYNFSKLIFDGMLRHLDAKKKFVMYPRFISIFLDKQLANVPVPLDHFPVNALTSKVFSFMVKKGKHFSGKVTPLFASMLVQPTEDEGAPSERPSEAQPTPSPAHTSEVPIEQQTDPSPRPSPSTIIPDSIPETSGGNLGGHSSSDKSLSGNEGEMTLQSLYDLYLSLCAQVSDQAKEIQHLKAQIKKLKKQAKPVIKHHRAWMESVSLKQRLARKRSSKKQWVHKEAVSKQGKKFAKGKPSVHRDHLFDEITEDTLDHMETKNAQVEGRTRDIVGEEKEIDENILSTEDVLSTDKEKLSTDKEKVSTDRPIVSTDGSKVSTDRQIEGTDEQIESTDEQRKGTEDHTEEGSATQATQTPTSTIFGDDETIAKVLLNMSQAKAVSREKEKGVELKDIEETDRPRPTSTRSLLTLKPLPKIDPKDKGKKKIEEEDESESESDGIPEAEKKFKQLESDEEMARKIQEEWEGEEERNRIAEEKATNEALIRNFDDIKARIEAKKIPCSTKIRGHQEQTTYKESTEKSNDDLLEAYEDFISIRSAKDERLIKRMNEKGIDTSKSEVIKEESKEEVKEENKEEDSTRKRKLGTRKKIKSRKRRYIQNISEDDSEKENDELRLHLTIAPDEEKEVDYGILDRKYPIKEWKIECLGTKPHVNKAKHLEEINQNVVIRSNGQKRYFSTLMRVLSIFDRDDLNAIYQLVMNKYQDEIPGGFDKVLWGDLMLHGSSGVHTLVTEAGLVIHMLVEKKYPLRKKVLVQMLELKLDSEEESTMALELIRFIKKLLAELEPEDSNGDEEDL